MSEGKIARRYARALIAIAVEKQELDGCQEDLSQLRDLFSADENALETLKNPLIETDERESLFKSLMGMVDVRNYVSDFARLLLNKNRIEIFCDVVDVFDRLADEQRGDVQVSLSSANELDDESTGRISALLEKRLGKNVIINKETDPSLLGGIVLRVGNRVIDGSIKGKLSQMGEALR